MASVLLRHCRAKWINWLKLSHFQCAKGFSLLFCAPHSDHLFAFDFLNQNQAEIISSLFLMQILWYKLLDKSTVCSLVQHLAPLSYRFVRSLQVYFILRLWTTKHSLLFTHSSLLCKHSHRFAEFFFIALFAPAGRIFVFEVLSPVEIQLRLLCCPIILAPRLNVWWIHARLCILTYQYKKQLF